MWVIRRVVIKLASPSQEVVTTSLYLSTSYKLCLIAPIAKQHESLDILLDQLFIKFAKMDG